ncbi:Eco57I restriction-modification methylase domain-containing protein [Paraburkholderia dioscoreae]|uniref:site-specific DNA-methyltransferase (adenine-specific) n=1 Tax=Paraburkholderia dioscoreae TaxID=2604047 RepID=A0A5Q4ZEF1_9BURK|nr:DNA methyltransferase [Paraburkholderia dioscoreae]VVD31063.1 conserved protein of unknown function [Paraburkholderia dioscoreae]
MIYPSIRIEGAILSPDVLDRLDDLAGQRPADFGLDGTNKVKDEIARAWADAQDYWRIFQRKLESLREDSLATTETRQQWVLPLLGLLGYQLEYQARSSEVNGKSYPLSHRVANRGQTVVHISGYRDPAGLDRKAEQRSGALRMSAHAMVQEYLNLSDELYGLVTNGRLLRLLRDSSRLIKLTYLEFDLDRIFTDGLFADFALLYRLLHASRLPAGRDEAAQSWIERYHQDSLDAGSRIREGLSKAVEQAILGLGNGFLQHRDNESLRQDIASARLGERDFYKHLLRLIYRLLFLMVTEERDLIFPASANAKHRRLYDQFYSVMRLRRLSEKRHLADRRHTDLWPALLATFCLFEADGPGVKIGVAPLAGDLFGAQALGPLARCTLGNDVVLTALRALNLYAHPGNGQLIRVNYGALNVEEFGSVYEGLLEYEPAFIHDGPRTQFLFKLGDDRANTGSHYTPDELVQPLIKHSLDHLIAEKLKEKDPVQALLELRVVDVSCGSGHILLAAARRIATELAVVRTGEDQPSPSAFRASIRDVICHCIYGVDLNPLAVELCRVALWLEAHNPGEPLNFLDHRIKCGNAIVGYARREEVERGVPDEAFATMPDDDKEIAAALRKRNKAERKGQASLTFSPEIERQLGEVLKGWEALDALPELTLEQIEAKKTRFLGLTQSADALLIAQMAAIPIAQFYIPKEVNQPGQHVTEEEFRRYWKGERPPHGQGVTLACSVAERKRFFHWFLEFPDVMSRGGFDCILGNPPYLGGQDLSGSYGHPFCHYVKWQFAPTGLSDLVVYFVRRIYSLLRPGGFAAFLTTNSIKDGDVRKDGLEQVLATGGQINFAVRGIKWPGRANLVISMLALYKGDWPGKRILDGAEVPFISAFLEDTNDGGGPIPLKSNADTMASGSYFLGDGFLLDSGLAEQWVTADRKMQAVLFPAINGDELNNQPTQVPSRSAIFFEDWPLERAQAYELAMQRVRELVKPERDLSPEKPVREKWWLWKRPAMEIYRKVRPLQRCFVAARTTKHFNFSALPTNYVFTNATYVFTTDRWDLYAVVQSTLHEVWARKYSGALETRLRYSPSDCFETFAVPGDLWQAAQPELAVIGERYHEHRRALMRELSLGLTDIYNLFHARDLNPAMVTKVSKKPEATARAGVDGLLELRRLRVQLDTAVRDAYGWTNLALDHDFVEVETLPENDRVRYTITPSARKEVLKRLLALNHDRAKLEAERRIVSAPVKRKPRVGKPPADSSLPLFDTDFVVHAPIEAAPFATSSVEMAALPDGAWSRYGTDRSNDELASLVAVLKTLGRPTPMREVRMIALMCMEPRLMMPLLTAEEGQQWLRLVGAEAQVLPAGVAQLGPQADGAWGRAVIQLRGSAALIEDAVARTWGPGVGLAEFETAGWPDGRAGVAVHMLRARGADTMLLSLPAELREAVDAKAA